MDTCQNRLVASFDQGESGGAPAKGAVNLFQLEEEVVAMGEADTLNDRIGVVIVCACAFADQGAQRFVQVFVGANVLYGVVVEPGKELGPVSRKERSEARGLSRRPGGS